ncbi:MAG TPA: 2,3-diphosphoglycerate-dependent phosphoglycerate mutase, partial [Sphingomicrobium sp.]|nr:2,3-diphosphoglycerate-dependent phosphoglycerate mutase [Sphingomicrobium sp.]
HGNSLRALVKHLSTIGDQEIVGLEIPTGEPMVYELGADLSVERRYYFSDTE